MNPKPMNRKSIVIRAALRYFDLPSERIDTIPPRFLSVVNRAIGEAITAERAAKKGKKR